MAELHEEILHFLEANATFDTLEYSEKKALDHQKVIGAIKSLQTTEGVPLSIFIFLAVYDIQLFNWFLSQLLVVEQKSKKIFQLNQEAEEIVQQGSHEAKVFSSIPDTGILQAELMVHQCSLMPIYFNK